MEKTYTKNHLKNFCKENNVQVLWEPMMQLTVIAPNGSRMCVVGKGRTVTEQKNHAAHQTMCKMLPLFKAQMKTRKPPTPPMTPVVPHIPTHPIQMPMAQRPSMSSQMSMSASGNPSVIPVTSNLSANPFSMPTMSGTPSFSMGTMGATS